MDFLGDLENTYFITGVLTLICVDFFFFFFSINVVNDRFI